MIKESKVKTGTVLRHSGDKTAIVSVERTVQHPVFKKYMKRRKNFHVHDEKNETGIGDKVMIAECRPMSKTKSWCLKSVLVKAK